MLCEVHHVYGPCFVKFIMCMVHALRCAWSVLSSNLKYITDSMNANYYQKVSLVVNKMESKMSVDVSGYQCILGANAD